MKSPSLTQPATPRTGVLLVNLGTPDEPTPAAVGRYLREFLMDPWVIDIPAPIRWLLVNLLIVPRRKHKSAEAYQAVWTERGSPLRVFHDEFVNGMRESLEHLGFEGPVLGAMRYGTPSLHSTMLELKNLNCDSVMVWPLYPQYAESTTRSILEITQSLASDLGLRHLSIRDFFSEPAFINPVADMVNSFSEKAGGGAGIDHVLFSFHGLPERHVRKTDRSARRDWCLTQANCCAKLNSANRDCYRAHCFATAREIAQRLGLSAERYTVSFQSRLGRDPWIKPYTDHVLRELAERGIRRLLVVTPSFVADCLETLEEIRIRAAEDFRQWGGKELIVVPCLNAEPGWISGASRLLLERLDAGLEAPR